MLKKKLRSLLNSFQVIEMPEHNTGQMGGTMRLGSRKTVFKTGESVLSNSFSLLTTKK